MGYEGRRLGEGLGKERVRELLKRSEARGEARRGLLEDLQMLRMHELLVHLLPREWETWRNCRRGIVLGCERVDV